jgi:hypothetical protein
MSKYRLGSRAQGAAHLAARDRAAITLGAGGLVLFRVALLVIVLAVAWHYGLS